MKKKLLSFVMALLVLPCAFMLMACGNSKLIGKYNIESITVMLNEEEKTLTKDTIDAEIADPNNSDEILQEMLINFKQMFENTTFEIKSHGKFVTTVKISLNGQTYEEKMEGKWTVKDNTITFTTKSKDAGVEDEVLNGEIRGEQIVVLDNSADESVTMVLAKIK